MDVAGLTLRSLRIHGGWMLFAWCPKGSIQGKRRNHSLDVLPGFRSGDKPVLIQP
jgi:hypothetical protein